MSDAAAAARAALGAGDGPDALRAVPGLELVQWKDGRAVLRGRDGDAAIFIKRFSRARRTEGRAEAEAYRRLAVTGVPAASLRAVEEAPDGALALVLEDAGPGLDEVLSAGPPGPPAGAVLERAARTVRALHAAGFSFPDLLARHLRVGSDREVRLIDLARLRGPGRTRPLLRAVDLGALFGTLPRLAVPERARLRLFRAAASDLSRGDRRALARRVAREAAKTRGRTRHRRRAIEVAPQARAALAAISPRGGEFDFWFGEEVGARLRLLPDRENRRVGAGDRVFFLKRHFAGSRAAVDELEGTLAFRRAGVPAALPAAVGDDAGRGSFWLAEAAPGEPLDALLAREGAVPISARRDLARILGGHAARLRRAGLFHRDFYLNHWIGRWGPERGWELALVDLQRWGRIGLRRERWFVKDAAALWHSARRTPLGRTDGVRFLRACFGIPRLDARARKFAKAVLRRAAAMAARRPRTPTS